jgi:hypothetical protein
MAAIGAAFVHVGSPRPSPGSVVVDQFEELFAPAVSDAERRAFVTALHTAATPMPDPDTDVGTGPVAVVPRWLRADFHGSCARFPELVTALEDHQLVVSPMTTPELRAASVEPANQTGLELQPGLVDRLLADSGADPVDEHAAEYDSGALPLLSHALLTTRQYRRGNQLTLNGYREAGGVTGAIATTAEHTYNSLDAAGQREAATLLPRMVNVGEDTPPRHSPPTPEGSARIPDHDSGVGGLRRCPAGHLRP